MVVSESRFPVWETRFRFSGLCPDITGFKNVSTFRCGATETKRKVRRFLLASSWTAGLLGGVIFSRRAGSVLSSWMPGILYCPVSFPGLLSVGCLPFFFSAIAVFLSRPALLYLAAAGKAFCVALVGAGILVSWGGAGWLVRWLVCSGSCAASPVLYFYWLRCLRDRPQLSFAQVAALAAAAATLGSFDYFVTAPLLARLIQF